MSKIPYEKTSFLLSVANINQLPNDTGTEIAIVGRSNSGKSSVLNRLTHNKKLAKTSKLPGRTQLINLFAIDAKRRIADLPGYGFAKVPLSIKEHWQKLLDEYIRTRDSLRAILLIMDIRHPLMPFDLAFLQWGHECHLPIHILLNKSDKLSKTAGLQTLKKVQAKTAQYQNKVTAQLFSALKNNGVEELQKILDHFFSD